jgi:two-component sensor histidine kinase
VTCDAVETEWMLSVSDNGEGNEKHLSAAEGGLGTGIVAALARQPNAEIVTESGPEGMSVSIAHRLATAVLD